jgi:NADH:ubiquinone oxidoreductase subunit
MGLFQGLFTWWNGTTLGTQLFTAWRGRLVGTDEGGGRYFEERVMPQGRPQRRWVVYKGLAEASKVPPAWHGWLHHTVDVPPTADAYRVKTWEKPHVPNLSGTPFAYRPPGSIYRGGATPKPMADYEPWTPDDT